MLDFMKSMVCNNCQGFRLKPEMLDYCIKEKNIGQLTLLTADDALKWISDDLNLTFETELEQKAAAALRENIIERLDALQKAGLGYISTGRIVGTLSGGEFQRLQLAGLIKAPLTGVAYILDEPSFGLHPKDIRLISDLILNLNRLGNSIIMVEHSPLLLEKSHYTVEIGPGAGSDGGQIMYSGNTKNVVSAEVNKLNIHQRKTNPGKGLNIVGANANNLKNINVEFPSGIMTVITGVSGSGKTSLLEKVIFESYSLKKPSFCTTISGFEYFSDLIYIEQPAQGKGHNATVGGKLGLSEVISKIFADSTESKKRGYKASYFIRGSHGSRCTTCEGTGFNQVSMDFFSDIISPCERCGGSGFRDEVLEVSIEGRSIYETLQISFDEISGFFDSHLQGKAKAQARSILELIKKTGLGHLACDRTLKTLSTGELQRLKLVAGLSAQTGNNTLFLFDEPTGGLHPKDIEKLIKLFEEILDTGNTIICITHEPLLIAASDKFIELGPGGGTQGGRIVS